MRRRDSIESPWQDGSLKDTPSYDNMELKLKFVGKTGSNLYILPKENNTQKAPILLSDDQTPHTALFTPTEDG
jgi:hypothetical protein